MKLLFPELGGGPQQGLNDAGVENFLGAIDSYLVRECGQNTGDAPQEGVQTTRLEFDRLTLTRGEIPAFDELSTTLSACLAKWGGDPKSRAFFQEAQAAAGQASISVLRISDYGTTGLTGGDSDERGRWFALVKSQGVSIKGDTAGGSFGIGKSSPFAASKFRTVFYGTRIADGRVGFQGVSRLVTHKSSSGKLTQGVGFIGDYDAHGGGDGEPVFRAVREEARILQPFRRTEPGTDIWVVGYRSGDDWQANILGAILNDFWPAIHFGKIEFRVGSQRVTQDNLADLIQQHAGDEDFDAHHYYRAVTSSPIKRTLRSIGSCELYLGTSKTELPRRICMARQSGMRIYDYAPRACRVPFMGLFICKDDRGNALLRQMEPPKHDTWDPKRVDGPEGKRALEEVKGWIRDEVKKLNPLFSGDSFNEDQLAKYLPDVLPEDQSPLPSEGTEGTAEEQLAPKPRSLAEPLRPISATPPAPPNGDADEGGVGTEDDSGNPPHSGKAVSEKDHSPAGGPGSTRPPRLRTRAFASGPASYTLVLRSDLPFAGALVIRAVGEDGSTDPVALLSATAVDLGESHLVEGHRVNGVHLAPDKSLTLSITLATAERRALTVALAS